MVALLLPEKRYGIGMDYWYTSNMWRVVFWIVGIAVVVLLVQRVMKGKQS